MLKKLSLLTAFLLGSAFALAQGSVYTDIVFNRFGEPMAGAVIYICLSDPGATPVVPCADLATVYTDLTLGTAVDQTTTPLTTDGYGNVVTGTKQGVYGVPGIYYMEVSGYAITAFSKVFAIPGTDGGGGGGGGGTPNFVTKTLLSGVFGDSEGFADGTNAVEWPNGVSFEANGGKFACTIGTTGTVTNQLVKIIQESGVAVCVNATTADSTNILGVCTEGCGAAGGTARVTVIGQANCVTDNQTVIGDVLTPSAITDGNCHDAGATEVPIIQNLGRALTLNTGTGTLARGNFGLPDSIGQPSQGNGSVSNCGTSGAIGRYPAAGTTIGCDPLFTSDGAGNTTAISHTTAGTGAGFLYFTQSTTPTLTPANSVMLFAPSSIASFFKLKLPAALGTTSQCLGLSGVSGDTGTLAFQTCGTVSVVKTCTIIIGADNGAALADADIGPQKEQCQVDAASTVTEIDIEADAGTPNVIVGKRHCTASACASNFTVSNLTSAALTTAASGGPACSKTGATAGLDTFTTCAATLQNTALAVGDYLETVSATAGGTAKRLSIHIHYSVP